MRTYLVIIDDTPESETALRFAARRAFKTGGAVEILAVIPKGEFVAWGSVAATIEQEAIDHAEAVVTSAAGTLFEELGTRPEIKVRHGVATAIIRAALAENAEIGALVLGAAASGAPGPLVSHFAAEAGGLPCPLMIVPGTMSEETLERIS